jgi:hypothetical protein
MLIQKMRALKQSLPVGIYRFYVGKICSGYPPKIMFNLYDMLSYNKVIIFCQEIINIGKRTGRGIFNWQYAVLRLAFLYLEHYLRKGILRNTFDIIFKIFEHCLLRIRTLFSIESNLGTALT